MEKRSEKKLLNLIKIIPIFILILFSFTTTYLMINDHNIQLNKEINNLKNNFIKQKKESIKKEVNKLYAMVMYEYNYMLQLKLDNHNINITKYHTTQHILKEIELMKYDKNGYIFIIDYDGNFLINVEKSLLETNQIELKDKSGFMISKEIIKLAKQGEGYLSYFGLLGTHNNQSQKISFVKGFDKWQWAIGYGFHPSDINTKILKRKLELENINNKVVKQIFITNIALTIIFIVFFILFTQNIQNRFNQYKKELRKIESNNRQKDEIIFHQSKMATIGELLNIISHQWRQPLAQINALTMDIYVEQKKGNLKEQVLKESIVDIEKTTKYLSNTIDDFSKFFIQEKEKTNFSPQIAIKECINILSPSLKSVDIQIKILKNTKINGFITLYQQVILTILTNSLDAFILKNIQNPTILITIDEKDNKSYISILDNAKGIEKKNLNKIFNLYFSTKKENRVTGLGLYIAKQIIQKNMNGDISVRNLKDGALFIIKV